MSPAMAVSPERAIRVRIFPEPQPRSRSREPGSRPAIALRMTEIFLMSIHRKRASCAGRS